MSCPEKLMVFSALLKEYDKCEQKIQWKIVQIVNAELDKFTD